MRWMIALLCLSPLFLEAQTGIPAIDRLIRAGEFKAAQTLIADRIAASDLPDTTA